jgi:hypothetical protein
MPVTGLAIHAPWNKEYIITAFIGNWNYSARNYWARGIKRPKFGKNTA